MSFISTQQKCKVCEKIVYPVEQLSADGGTLKTRSPSKAVSMYSGTQEKRATCSKTVDSLEKGVGVLDSKYVGLNSGSTFIEGRSIFRPPLFQGEDYPYWKTRMRIFLQSLDYEVWKIVIDGYNPSTKPSSEWTVSEMKKSTLNAKAMNALYCALDKKEFHKVFCCVNAFEIWNKLEVVYEGTSQVKESKINRLIRQYELFHMEENERIHAMYTRFTEIVNSLSALGNTFTNSEKVKKILRSLPKDKEWRLKRTVIEEVKDLNTLSLDDLIGSLISYEEDLAIDGVSEKKKKKTISFRSSIVEEDDSDDESIFGDEDLRKVAVKFSKFFKKEKATKKSENEESSKGKEVVCYHCEKPGHIKLNCPLIYKGKKKKKNVLMT